MRGRNLAAAVMVFAMGCNAILGINPPHVIDEDDGGAIPAPSGTDTPTPPSPGDDGASTSVSDGGVDSGRPSDGGADSGDAAHSSDAGPGDAGLGDSGPDAGSGDAGPAEAGPVDSGPPNLIDDPSFLQGCDEWHADGLTVTPSNVGRTDGHSCMLCSTGIAYFGMFTDVTGRAPIKFGAKYHAEAWVRAVPMRDAAPDMALEVEIDRDELGRTVQNQKVGGLAQLTNDWQLLAGGYKVVEGADGGNIFVMVVNSRMGDDNGTDRCFLVDDVDFHATGP